MLLLRPFLKPFRYAFRELILHRRKQIPFWILVGFLPTFFLARFTVQHFPYLFVHVHGTHVHHFIYGFFVLATMGFIALITDRARRVQAFFYGAGLALAFDEFGMWVRLTDHYNIDASEDAIAIIAAILVFLVYGIGIVRRALPQLKKLRPRR
ncbi:MAG TPA: hypothetical protein VMT30_04985 [Candidatus Saccharimonadia bacterium]|nr:hypothetical protein [Candidatus Saccharimonadia bacterium]